MKASAFYTRTPANKGALLTLVDPVTGKQTDQYLHVLGLESDKFRAALAAKHQRNMEILQMPEPEQKAASDDAELELYASLVSDWSFEEPITVAGVKELFLEAPQIKQEVDKFAGQRANFMPGLLGS